MKIWERHRERVAIGPNGTLTVTVHRSIDVGDDKTDELYYKPNKRLMFDMTMYSSETIKTHYSYVLAIRDLTPYN